MGTRNYHEVFIPFMDVYELSGPEVFPRLSPRKDDRSNLIVIPYDFVERLDRMIEVSNSAAKDVLEALVEMRSRVVPSQEKGVYVCRASEDCDDVHVAFLDRSRMGDSGDFSITKLEEKVQELWGGSGKPVLLTNKEKHHIKYGNRGSQVQKPRFLQVSSDIVNEGIIEGSEELYARLQENGGKLSLDRAAATLNGRELYVHQFIRFSFGDNYEFARVAGKIVRNNARTRITRVEDPFVKLLGPDEKGRKIKVGRHVRDEVLGISPRDSEQYLAMQYGLLNPDVSLFFLCGEQGSGKTLLAYVTAIDQILCYDQDTRQKRIQKGDDKSGSFKQVILLKPNEMMGGKRRDVGFLPGSLYDKLKPHLEPYIDAHKESILGGEFPFTEMLAHPKYSSEWGQREWKGKIGGNAHLPPNTNAIELPFSGHLRGRSFIDTLIVVDEAQNFTPYEMKTVIERAGEGCKVIVMGDPRQVDNPSCSRGINGLTGAISNFLHTPYTALVNLSRNYRSQMSDDARTWRAFSGS